MGTGQGIVHQHFVDNQHTSYTKQVILVS